MKKQIIILTTFLFIWVNLFANSGKKNRTGNTVPPDTSLLTQILALPLQNYIGKPVDSLFLVLPGGYNGRGFMNSKIGYIKGVYQIYGSSEFNNLSIEIYVDNYQFLSVPDRTKNSSTWDMTLAKKETVAYIKVFKNYQCVYGCGNPNYWMQ